MSSSLKQGVSIRVADECTEQLLFQEDINVIATILHEEEMDSRERVKDLLAGVDRSFFGKFVEAHGLQVAERFRADIRVINEAGEMDNGIVPMHQFIVNAEKQTTDVNRREKLKEIRVRLETQRGIAPSLSHRNNRELVFRYIGRELCWAEIAKNIGIDIPPNFAKPDTTYGNSQLSFAFVYDFESTNDRPERFASALCYWIRTKGDICGNTNHTSKTYDFAWSKQFKKSIDIFCALVDKLDNDDSFAESARLSSVSDYASRLVEIINQQYGDQFACIYLEWPDASQKNIAIEFIDEWNEQIEIWSRLHNPLVMLMAVPQESAGLFAGLLRKVRLKTNVESIVIGKLDSASYREWVSAIVGNYLKDDPAWLAPLRKIIAEEIEQNKWKDYRYAELAKKIGVQI